MNARHLMQFVYTAALRVDAGRHVVYTGPDGLPFTLRQVGSRSLAAGVSK